MPKVNKVGATRERQTTPANDVGTMPASAFTAPTTVPQTTAPMTTNVPTTDGHVSGNSLANINAVLPAFLTVPGGAMPTIAPSELEGYAGFASSMSDNWMKQQQAGCSEGDPYIVYDGQIIKCAPLEYVLLAGRSFRTSMMGKEMRLLWCSEDVEDMGPDNLPSTAKAQAHYVCLMLVKVGSVLRVIRGDFRGTKDGAAKRPVQEIEDAANPEWAKQSEAHRVAAVFPQPWGRVWNSVAVQPGIGRASGNKYYAAQCKCTPINPSQMELIGQFFQDPASINALEIARRGFEERCQFFVNESKKYAA
jgi:hypothetical protein